MTRVWVFLKYLTSRLYMQIAGVHFHPSSVVSNAVPFDLLAAESNYGRVIFSFHKLEVTSMTLRFGRVVEKPYKHYYVHAHYPSGFPMDRFGEDKVVLSVRGDRLSSWTDSQICHMLMKIYLSYITFRLA